MVFTETRTWVAYEKDSEIAKEESMFSLHPVNCKPCKPCPPKPEPKPDPYQEDKSDNHY